MKPFINLPKPSILIKSLVIEDKSFEIFIRVSNSNNEPRAIDKKSIFFMYAASQQPYAMFDGTEIMHLLI